MFPWTFHSGLVRLEAWSWSQVCRRPGGVRLDELRQNVGSKSEVDDNYIEVAPRKSLQLLIGSKSKVDDNYIEVVPR